MEIKQKRECTEDLIDLMQYFGSLLNKNGVLPDFMTLIWLLAWILLHSRIHAPCKWENECLLYTILASTSTLCMAGLDGHNV